MGYTQAKKQGLVRNTSAVPRTFREKPWCLITTEVSVFDGVTGIYRLSFLKPSFSVHLMASNAKKESYLSTCEELWVFTIKQFKKKNL